MECAKPPAKHLRATHGKVEIGCRLTNGANYRPWSSGPIFNRILRSQARNHLLRLEPLARGLGRVGAASTKQKKKAVENCACMLARTFSDEFGDALTTSRELISTRIRRCRLRQGGIRVFWNFQFQCSKVTSSLENLTNLFFNTGFNLIPSIWDHQKLQNFKLQLTLVYPMRKRIKVTRVAVTEILRNTCCFPRRVPTEIIDWQSVQFIKRVIYCAA